MWFGAGIRISAGIKFWLLGAFHGELGDFKIMFPGLHRFTSASVKDF